MEQEVLGKILTKMAIQDYPVIVKKMMWMVIRSHKQMEGKKDFVGLNILAEGLVDMVQLN